MVICTFTIKNLASDNSNNGKLTINVVAIISCRTEFRDTRDVRGEKKNDNSTY